MYKNPPFLDLVWEKKYRLTVDVRTVQRTPQGLILPQGFSTKDEYPNWDLFEQLPKETFEKIFPEGNIRRLDLFEVFD